jgi:raffinose/stachyose/melibiose transport system permease protein
VDPAIRFPTRFLARLISGAAADSRQTSRAAVSIFLAPALLIYAGFTVYPVLRTFYNSVHSIRPHGVVEFVGLRNFIDLLTHDPVFWKAASNTAIFAVVGTFADVLGGLLLALCLFARVPLAQLLRVIWFTPVLMSYVVVGIIWVWIYDFDWGLINIILRWLGLGVLEHSWLGDPSTALWAVLITHLWKWLGFNMIICLAALYALPEEVLGAAELDYCGWFAKLVYIIIPMLRPTLVNLLVLSFIGKMMIFDLVWIMTAGGPLWSTETVSTYVYKRAFDWNTFDLGYPSAIAVLWFAMILIFVIIITGVLRQRDKLEF